MLTIELIWSTLLFHLVHSIVSSGLLYCFSWSAQLFHLVYSIVSFGLLYCFIRSTQLFHLVHSIVSSDLLYCFIWSTLLFHLVYSIVSFGPLYCLTKLPLQFPQTSLAILIIFLTVLTVYFSFLNLAIVFGGTYQLPLLHVSVNFNIYCFSVNIWLERKGQT